MGDGGGGGDGRERGRHKRRRGEGDRKGKLERGKQVLNIIVVTAHIIIQHEHGDTIGLWHKQPHIDKQLVLCTVSFCGQSVLGSLKVSFHMSGWLCSCRSRCRRELRHFLKSISHPRRYSLSSTKRDKGKQPSHGHQLVSVLSFLVLDFNLPSHPKWSALSGRCSNKRINV